MKRMIIDVREPSEYAEGHAKDAVNIPSGEIASGAQELRELDKDTEIILYCRSGGRANGSLQALQQLGFTNLVNGINAEQVESKYPSL